jgi:3-deoxy-D-manno-octulosonic-acid transferase
MLVLYSLLMSVLLVFSAPWWLLQMGRTGKYREGLGERLGRVPARLARPSRRGSIWVHAVSVGEVLAASRLVQELTAELGRAQTGTEVYISTTTRTGQTLARERFGADRVFYFPLDFAFAMRAWLRCLRPGLVVLVESELWPRMLMECSRAGVPVAVVNGRVSDRSWPRYQRLRRLWRPLFGTLALVLAQSEADAARMRALGAAGAVAAGNLKYDVRVASPAQATAELEARLPAGVPMVVCGSTLGGEEELLLAALPLGEIVTVLAPRHPERFDGVARLLDARGIRCVRRSGWAETDAAESVRSATPATPAVATALAPGTVVLLDSVGELASVYSLATLAILGGGFLWPGGHNPLEPAQFGVPVLMGARYANFRAVVEALMSERAVVISDPAGLKTTIAGLLADTERRRAVGERGWRVFEQHAGATGIALSALRALLPAQTCGRPAGCGLQNREGIASTYLETPEETFETPEATGGASPAVAVHDASGRSLP